MNTEASVDTEIWIEELNISISYGMLLNPYPNQIRPYINYFKAPGDMSLKLNDDVIAAWDYAVQGWVGVDQDDATFFTTLEIT